MSEPVSSALPSIRGDPGRCGRALAPGTRLGARRSENKHFIFLKKLAPPRGNFGRARDVGDAKAVAERAGVWGCG